MKKTTKTILTTMFAWTIAVANVAAVITGILPVFSLGALALLYISK